MEDDAKDKSMRIQALAMSLVDQSVVLVVEGDEKNTAQALRMAREKLGVGLAQTEGVSARMMLASTTSSLQGR